MAKNLRLPDRAEQFPYGQRDAGARVDYQIERFVRSLSDPIIVYPGWEDALPAKLIAEIPLERMVRVYRSENDDHCGDLEAMAYLYTASLSISLSDHWGKIYLNIAKQHRNKLGLRIDNIASDELTEQEYQMLSDLKSWIRWQQQKIRK